MLESATPPRHQPDPGPAPRRVVRVGSLEAVRRHWLLAATPVVLLLVAALAYALTREVEYTAEARLAVSRIGLTSPGALNGFPVASASLASTYSRAIDAGPLAEDVGRRIGASPAEVRTRLSATPVPASPIVRVMAEGPSEPEAVRTANVAASALQRYIVSLNRENPNASRLYSAYREAALVTARRRRELSRLENIFGLTPTESESRRLARADADLDAARLRQQIFRSAYTEAQSTQSTVSVLQKLSGASAATSDRLRHVQFALFVAVAVGGLLGVALATARANRVARRRAIG